MYERHLAYSNPRPKPFLWADSRYVVLRDDRLGRKDTVEVLVEDERYNVIGWQYPKEFTGPDAEKRAREFANTIWVQLREDNVEIQARLKASEEKRKAAETAKNANWAAATEQAKQAADWDSLHWMDRRARIQQLVAQQG